MTTEQTLDVDLGYHERDIFTPFHDRTERWACMICHRRAGKTVASINDLIGHALLKPHGRYAYIAPLRNQAKTVAWDYLTEFSRPVQAQPPNQAELRVDLINGSRITLFGADNPDALRGPFFDGVVLDEYADIAPSLWTKIVRPALADRGGFATIIGTVKGCNQLWKLYEVAASDSTWFTDLLKASETHVLPEAELADARRTMTRAAYAAEFECDPFAEIPGAYYAKEMAECAREGRITDALRIDPSRPVHTAWDLGNGANMAIWAFQEGERGPLVQDFLQIQDYYLEDYIDELKVRGYDGFDYVPQDAKVHSFETGRTRIESFIAKGRKPKLVMPHNVEDGINAGRITLRTAKFNATKCEMGIEALRQYRQEWDEKAGVFRKVAEHDSSSHPADAWRYLAMAWRAMVAVKAPEPKRTRLTYGDLAPMISGDQGRKRI